MPASSLSASLSPGSSWKTAVTLNKTASCTSLGVELVNFSFEKLKTYGIEIRTHRKETEFFLSAGNAGCASS